MYKINRNCWRRAGSDTGAYEKHTTFKIGGPAAYFVRPRSVEELKAVLKAAAEEKITVQVIGNGSNLLVSDAGYDGIVIQIGSNMNQISVEGNQVTAQAGALLSRIAFLAMEQSLTGFEFASGIPGTLGGALVMNAGAYGGEMKDVVQWAKVLTPEGEVLTLTGEELELGYRTSIIAKKAYLVLEAALHFQTGDKAAIKARMDELKEARTTKQPLEYPSAGSTFKRPEGHFAGKLIMDAGLAGFRVGDAMVSAKHCGFVVNAGEATAEDVQQLMAEVQRQVEEKFQVKLEPEIKRIGF